jgi:acyl-coenzyme A thioesterase 9
VEAATVDLHTGEKVITNTFHYTFASSEPMKRYVLPEDYADGIRWLESMRKKEVGRALRKLYGLPQPGSS